MNISAPFRYGQVTTPSESPQSSVANTTTGLSGVGQASTYCAAVNTALSSAYAPYAAPASSDPSIILANLQNVSARGTTLYSDYVQTPEQAAKFK